MARSKSQLKKDHLSHATTSNQRAPLWVYMKTQDKGVLHKQRRNWRYATKKVGNKIESMDEKSAKFRWQKMPKKKLSRKWVSKKLKK
jgi:ribosomal protein L39E